MLKGDQVFNVGNNLFTYDEAKNVCKSFDGELASLKQVMDSYKDGADWCNYGWIKGQMAVFPHNKLLLMRNKDRPIVNV